MDRINATLRGGDANSRDLFVGECQLFIIQVYCKEELDFQGLWTRIGPWDKIQVFVKELSEERKNKKGGYRKRFFVDDTMKGAGYLNIVMEIRGTANSKAHLLHINVEPAFCI